MHDRDSRFCQPGGVVVMILALLNLHGFDAEILVI